MPFDPEMADRWAEILRLREQIRKLTAKQKRKGGPLTER